MLLTLIQGRDKAEQINHIHVLSLYCLLLISDEQTYRQSALSAVDIR